MVPGLDKRAERDLNAIDPRERLTGTVVKVEPLKHGKLVRLEFSLGGPLRLITAWVKKDENHPIGSRRNFCLEWRWDYKDRSWAPTAKYLSEG